MPREVNQENVRLLIPGKAACVAAIIAEKRNILPQEALLAFSIATLSTSVWRF